MKVTKEIVAYNFRDQCVAFFFFLIPLQELVFLFYPFELLQLMLWLRVWLMN